MVDEALLSKVKQLSSEDRLELVGLLWDSLSPTDIPVTEEEKRFLDGRLKEHREDPDDVVPWSDVKAKLEDKLR